MTTRDRTRSFMLQRDNFIRIKYENNGNKSIGDQGVNTKELEKTIDIIKSDISNLYDQCIRIIFKKKD